MTSIGAVNASNQQVKVNEDPKKNSIKQQDESVFESELTFGDKMSAFNKGFADTVMDGVDSTIEFAKENPVLAGACVVGAGCVCALAAMSSVVGIALGGLGLLFGGKQLWESGKEMKENVDDLKNAKSDEEMLKIINEMGSDSVDLVGSAVQVGCSASLVTTSAKAAILSTKAATTGAAYTAAKSNPNLTPSQLRNIELDAIVPELQLMGLEVPRAVGAAGTAILTGENALDQIEDYLDY